MREIEAKRRKKSLHPDSKLPVKEKLAMIEKLILAACRPRRVSMASSSPSWAGGYECRSCGERFKFDHDIGKQIARASFNLSLPQLTHLRGRLREASQLEKNREAKRVMELHELLKRDKEMTRGRFDVHDCGQGAMLLLGLLKKHGATMVLIDAFADLVGLDGDEWFTVGGGSLDCNLCIASVKRPRWMAQYCYPRLRHRGICPISLVARFFPEKSRPLVN